MITAAVGGRKGSRKSKSDSVGVTSVRKIRHKKLKKKPPKSNCVTGSANAFGNCLLLHFLQKLNARLSQYIKIRNL